jgi:hypothetical protein
MNKSDSPKTEDIFAKSKHMMHLLNESVLYNAIIATLIAIGLIFWGLWFSGIGKVKPQTWGCLGTIVLADVIIYILFKIAYAGPAPADPIQTLSDSVSDLKSDVTEMKNTVVGQGQRLVEIKPRLDSIDTVLSGQGKQIDELKNPKVIQPSLTDIQRNDIQTALLNAKYLPQKCWIYAPQTCRSSFLLGLDLANCLRNLGWDVETKVTPSGGATNYTTMVFLNTDYSAPKNKAIPDAAIALIRELFFLGMIDDQNTVPTRDNVPADVIEINIGTRPFTTDVPIRIPSGPQAPPGTFLIP